jgi:hypothetical protein
MSPARSQAATAQGQRSFPKGFGRGFDPDWFAEHAGHLFAEWLRAEYRGNIRVIAQTFGVREQTVAYWLAQSNVPNGAAMMGAVIAFPPLRERIERAYAKHLGVAA